ncbi:MAG TPA: homoserine dehydrogenase [Gemmataceae bacterium]|nr:homoserine dehydrogenase [Gemmataceae bacterium]
MSETLNLALLGCGTVGGGVAKLLLEERDRMAQRAGRPLNLKRVVVRDPAKPRAVPMPRELVGTDIQAAITDPNVQVIVELIGGVEVARAAVLAALAAGKHVVTANKALLAQHGPEIYEAARRAERVVAFEASVAGGVPIVAALSQGLAANQIISLQGILNGTSNFILTEMTEQQQTYAAALAEAQRRGFAEADPTLDVDGTDSAHKLAILAQLAFGVAVPISAISRRGVAGIHDMDIRFASELHHTVKLLAEAWLSEGQLALQVAPVLLRNSTPMAQVRGSANAIQVYGDLVGETLFYGPGAGAMPTASAVLADLIDLAVGRAQRTFANLRLWSLQSASLRPADSVRSRFYLRLLVEDRPGVLADVCRALADEQVSISSVIQHEALDEREGDIVPLVILTHTALTGRFRAAAEDISRLRGVTAPSVYFSVAD